jgi:hypothetical protein
MSYERLGSSHYYLPKMVTATAPSHSLSLGDLWRAAMGAGIAARAVWAAMVVTALVVYGVAAFGFGPNMGNLHVEAVVGSRKEASPAARRRSRAAWLYICLGILLTAGAVIVVSSISRHSVYLWKLYGAWLIN